MGELRKYAEAIADEPLAKADRDWDDRLTQPAQLLGGALAGTAGADIAHRAGVKFAEKPARLFGMRQGAKVRLAHRQVKRGLGEKPPKPVRGSLASFLGPGAEENGRAAARSFNETVARRQSHVVSRLARGGMKGALVGTAVAGGAIAGDFAGDWTARRLTGAKGKDDTYRNLSLTGMATAAAGGTAAAVGASHWRKARWFSSGGRRNAVLGAAALGAIGGELVGNAYDRRFGVTENIAGTDRRLGMRKFDESEHPRDEDGRFTSKVAGAVKNHWRQMKREEERGNLLSDLSAGGSVGLALSGAGRALATRLKLKRPDVDHLAGWSAGRMMADPKAFIRGPLKRTAMVQVRRHAIPVVAVAGLAALRDRFGDMPDAVDQAGFGTRLVGRVLDDAGFFGLIGGLAGKGGRWALAAATKGRIRAESLPEVAGAIGTSYGVARALDLTGRRRKAAENGN